MSVHQRQALRRWILRRSTVAATAAGALAVLVLSSPAYASSTRPTAAEAHFAVVSGISSAQVAGVEARLRAHGWSTERIESFLLSPHEDAAGFQVQTTTSAPEAAPAAVAAGTSCSTATNSMTVASTLTGIQVASQSQRVTWCFDGHSILGTPTAGPPAYGVTLYGSTLFVKWIVAPTTSNFWISPPVAFRSIQQGQLGQCPPVFGCTNDNTYGLQLTVNYNGSASRSAWGPPL